MEPFRWMLSLLWLSAEVNAGPSTIDVGYTKYRGVELSNGITQWLGMRFAAPPTGQLRFKPPQEPDREDGVRDANKHRPHCLATGEEPDDPDTSEDCLFIEVTAPTKAVGNAKLPVFFYIQGGGFNKNSNPDVNATGLIEAADMDMVYVGFNYRVGPWGFLTNGDEIEPNNGLRDQRKALEWVQRHIVKFGGDPEHVVIGGSSAGAASVSYHLTAYNGTGKKLFHGALAGSPSYGTMYTAKESQYQYNQLVTRIGCVGSDSLACLRKKTAKEIQEVNFNIPLRGGANPPLYQWLPTIDGELVPDYLYKSFREGKFVKVPTIFGDDENGGTQFVPKKTSTLAESNQFLIDQYPTLTPEQLGKINSLYPNPNKSCPERGCYWRQASNAYQEARYMCPGLFMTSTIASKGEKRSYAYLWNVKDPEQEASGLGVPHTVEVSALFAPGYPNTPESYKKGEINEKAVHVFQGYFSSFIRSFDPNKYRKRGSTEWKTWDEDADKRLVFETKGISKMESLGDLRERCTYWEKIGLEMLL